MPIVRACASASHAVHSSSRPRHQRSAAGMTGQAAGPPRSSQAPPSTQASMASHQAMSGAWCTQPNQAAAAQASASAPPIKIARPGAPLSRAHSSRRRR